MSTNVFKLILAALIMLLLALQYRLWFAENSLRDTARLEVSVGQHIARNKKQQALNDQLRADVNSLKQGLDAIESKARSELGMVKPDETFFLVVQPDPEKKSIETARDTQTETDGVE